jgi:hypothetical protein
MALVPEIAAAVILMILTLALQCAGMAALIHRGRTRFARRPHKLGPWGSAMVILGFTTIIVVLHGLQILLWAWFYRWKCFPSWESAFYFSGATYSTVGAGDLPLPGTWRMLGAVESIIGVLMCGLSVSFLFAFVALLIQREAPELAWARQQIPQSGTPERDSSNQ